MPLGKIASFPEFSYKRQKNKEKNMGYTQVALEDKILQMYPEISNAGITPRLSFDPGRNGWTVNFVRGKQSFTVYLDKKDADSCMDNTYCEAFKTALRDVIKNLEKS